MNELTKILETIRRPFRHETHNKYKNNVVVNGLGNYVQLWVKRAQQLSLNPTEKQFLDGLANIFTDYETQSPTERRRIIEEATKQIDEMTSSWQKESPVKTRDELPLFQPTPPLVEVNAPTPKESGASADKPQTAPPPEVIITDTPPSTDATSLDFLTTPVQYAKGIGPRRSAMLAAELEIRTVGDLLEYYPRDYIDRANIRSIYDVGRTGEDETIQGKVVNQTQFTPRRQGAKTVGKIAVYDGTGVAQLVNFGRRVGYMRRTLEVGMEIVVSGQFARRNNEIQTTQYEFEVLEAEDADLIHTGRIVPKYSLTAKLTQRSLRQWVKTVLDEYADRYPEIMPLEIRQQHQLIDRQSAIKDIHYPASDAHLQAARKRLVFDEFFLLELGLELKKRRWETEEKGIAFKREGTLIERFIATLPFELTNAQKRVSDEIQKDMVSPQAMNRLLQGDVGSGKTVVAAIALLRAIQNGYQGALMVPTEILAEQHATNLSELLRPLELNVVLLKGDLPKKERDIAINEIVDGNAHIIVGTHALIQEGVEFDQLGLVIIDEQHRFGVMQRATLRDKGNTPDVLVMTATPIPRTLALTVYGDLNVSVIDEMPPGRQTITTRWVKEDGREKLYEQIEQAVRRGRQAYIVYPLVEESEKLQEIKAATEMAAHFQHDVFPHLRVALLHGRMHSNEKQEVMTQFKAQQIDILVSTTVIEVGIDVPNATLMVIENAERFGLAQLHQLRGRVGRGKHKSTCYIVGTPKNDEAIARIKVMRSTNDGFEIAEADLEIRGPGEFFGTRQSGLPDFKIANLIKDAQLLELAKADARRIAQTDPRLRRPEHQALLRMLQSYWKDNLEMVSIG